MTTIDKPVSSKFVGDATTDELLLEIKRRKDNAIAARYEARNNRFSVFTIDDANRFFPEHDTTSCSDVNTCNGFGSGRKPRCGRCAIVQIVQEGIEIADNMDVRFSIDFEEIER